MSGSLTVTGGNSSIQGNNGLVSIPSGFTGSVITSLQALLTSVSGAATTGGANFENLNVAGQSGTISAGAGTTGGGILVVSNTNSVGTVSSGSAAVSLSVPAGYNTLIVQAPGTETITGNGAAGFLGVFGANSSVNFNDGGGSGSVFASGNDTVVLSGSDSFIGGSGGGDSVTASGATAAVTLAGVGSVAGAASNRLVATGANATIQSGGSDYIISRGTSVNDVITVAGNATIQNAGAADTITAAGTGAFIGFFGGSAGGRLEFINTSTGASSLIASLNPTTGAISSQGSVTISAGAGGGIYDGGVSGNNSLIGGSGVVSLFSAGVNNYLFTNGDATGSNSNLLNAYSGGNDTLIAGSGSTNNVFFGGTGTESIQSSGTGTQFYFVGTLGAETISASTVTGATNQFIFQQAASQGGGTDVLLNFRPGDGVINQGNNVTGVTVLSYESLSGAHSGTEVDLSNGTTVKLLGLSPSALNASIIGGTHF